jgi:hypothetical protein
MNKRKYKNKKEVNKVNEPDLQYEAHSDENTIRFFLSFTEQEKDNYSYLAGLTSIQHLQNATALIKRIFAEDLKKNPKIGNRIYFK